jgi:hypothetical protein
MTAKDQINGEQKPSVKRGAKKQYDGQSGRALASMPDPGQKVAPRLRKDHAAVKGEAAAAEDSAPGKVHLTTDFKLDTENSEPTAQIGTDGASGGQRRHTPSQTQ